MGLSITNSEVDFSYISWLFFCKRMIDCDPSFGRVFENEVLSPELCGELAPKLKRVCESLNDYSRYKARGLQLADDMKKCSEEGKEMRFS